MNNTIKKCIRCDWELIYDCDHDIHSYWYIKVCPVCRGKIETKPYSNPLFKKED